MEIVGKTINTKGFVKMPSKMLELKSELEVHLSPTPRGIGVTLAPETPGKAASYAEYNWTELIGGLCKLIQYQCYTIKMYELLKTVTNISLK